MFNFFKKKDETDNEKSLQEVMANTSKSLVQKVLSFVGNDNEFDDLTLEDIDTLLIKADLGVDFSGEIIEKIKAQKIQPNEFKNFLKTEFKKILDTAGDTALNYKENELNIYMVLGINGAGKTTLIGKLANKFKENGKKVLIAAADTFRAAATDQLDAWAIRANVDIVRRDGADSASVVYESIKKAQDEHYDVLLIDTAGRLQNKFNLIEELKKIKNVMEKLASNSLRETFLVLDANLGQNGLSQAKVFQEATDVSAVAMTKLDGSAKGGMILAVAKEYNLPTKLIGVGEKITDIQEFSPKDFIEALFI